MTSAIAKAVLIFLLCVAVTGKLVSVPENQVVLVGKTVEFRCSTTETYDVNWQHVPFGSRSFEDVYISSRVVGRYSLRYNVQKHKIENNVTEYNLYISNAQKEDAGMYKCIDEAGQGEKGEAQLSLLDDHPKCTTNIGLAGFIGENICGVEREIIQCSCSIGYTGKIAPEMQLATSKGKIIPDPVVPVMRTDKTVSFHLRITASTALDKHSIIWYLMDSKQTIIWASNTIKIYFVEEQNTAISIQSSQEIICWANSSVPCNYHWKSLSDMSNSLEAYYPGQRLKPVHEGVFLCEAICTLHNKTCTVPSLRLEYSSAIVTDKTKVPILVVIVVLLAVACVAATAGGFVLSKKLKTRNAEITKSSSDTSSNKGSSISTSEENMSPSDPSTPLFESDQTPSSPFPDALIDKP